MGIFSKPPPPEAVSDDQGRSPHCTQFAISKALENGHSMGKFGPKIVLSPDSGEAQSKRGVQSFKVMIWLTQEYLSSKIWIEWH